MTRMHACVYTRARIPNEHIYTHAHNYTYNLYIHVYIQAYINIYTHTLCRPIINMNYIHTQKKHVDKCVSAHT